MDIRRKIELAERAIEMVATHDAVDLVVIDAALQRLVHVISVKKREAQDRAQQSVAKELGGGVA